MTDPTPAATTSAAQPAPDEDPLQANSVIHEALQLVTGDTVSMQEEARSVQALTQSFEDYVSRYTAAFAQTWAQSAEQWQSEVENWQAEMEKLQAQTPDTLQGAPQGVPAPSSDAALGTNALLEHMQALKNHLIGAQDDDEGGGEEAPAPDDSDAEKATAPTKKKS